MRQPITVALLMSFLLLLGCNGGGQSANTKAFLGGSQGIVISFDVNAPPKNVFDGGDFPFDVAVKLQNKGEFSVPKDKAIVSVTGIMPQEFNVKESDLKKSPADDLIGRKTDNAGSPIEPGEVFVEFTGLNHMTFITGNALDYPVRAEICYLYGTTAASSLCIRKNLGNPAANGLCDIESARPLSTSGAPVQVNSVKEYQRGRDSVGFTFTVQPVSSSTGKVYAMDSQCANERSVEDRVLVNVKTGIAGLTCQGLSGSSEGSVEGVVPIYDTSRVITCTQTIASPGDYEAPVAITLSYDYQDYVETTLTVKHSGENTTS